MAASLYKTVLLLFFVALSTCEKHKFSVEVPSGENAPSMEEIAQNLADNLRKGTHTDYKGPDELATDGKRRECDTIELLDVNAVLAVEFDADDYIMLQINGDSGPLTEIALAQKGIFRTMVPEPGEYKVCFTEAMNPNFNVKWHLYTHASPTGHLWAGVKTTKTPSARAGHTAIEHDGKMYVIGGYDGTTELKDTVVLDLKKLKWSTLEDLPAPRVGHTLLKYKDGLIVFGGKANDEEFTDTLFRFDIDSDSWETLETTGETPGGRYGHAATIVGNKMYVFGGEGTPRKIMVKKDPAELAEINKSDEELQREAEELATQAPSEQTLEELSNAERITEGDPEWQEVSKDWPEVEEEEQVILDDLWELNLDTLKWTKLPGNGIMPEARAGATLWPVDKRLVLLGGTSQLGYFSWANQYNLETQEWEELELYGTIAMARGGHTAIPLGDTRYLVIGGIGYELLADMFIINVGGQTMWPVPSLDADTVVGHSTVMYDGWLYQFGGFDGEAMLPKLAKFRVKDFETWAHPEQLKIREQMRLGDGNTLKGDPLNDPADPTNIAHYNDPEQADYMNAFEHEAVPDDNYGHGWEGQEDDDEEFHISEGEWEDVPLDDEPGHPSEDL